MDIDSVFEWFAQESAFAAETTNDQQQREIWLRLAAMWMSAAIPCRHGESDGPADADRPTPNDPHGAHGTDFRHPTRLNDPGRALDKHGSNVGLELRHRREKEARFRLGEDGHGSTGSMAEAGSSARC